MTYEFLDEIKKPEKARKNGVYHDVLDKFFASESKTCIFHNATKVLKDSCAGSCKVYINKTKGISASVYRDSKTNDVYVIKG